MFTNAGLKYGENGTAISGTASCSHIGCPDGQQNGSAEMLDRHGARVDDGPPVIELVEPQAGDTVQAPFDVVVRVNDAFGGVTPRSRWSSSAPSPRSTINSRSPGTVSTCPTVR